MIDKLRELKHAIGLKLGNNYIKIDYIASKDKLKIYCPHSFEDRTVKTLEMFMMAFENAKLNIKDDFHIALNCEDFPDGKYKNKRTIFAYTKKNTDEETVLMPDFCFLNWKESGMADYEQCWKTMVEESKKEPEHNTLFWIGNTKTHPTRGTLCELSEKDERIEAYGMDWTYSNNKAIPTKYISLTDHTQYKYLIDVQGRGYSGRTKMLMFTGRPLFIAERQWDEFWTKDVVPFVHYIPVKEDLSDLIEKLDWAENNPEECKKISKNAQEFAMSNLRREDAIDYLAGLIVECSKKF